MNKKLTAWIVVGFFLVSLASAGIIGISAWNQDISLDKTSTDRIKAVADISEIDVEIGEIQCDEDECWATLFQKNLIQDEWRRDKGRCLELNTTRFENGLIDGSCIIWEDYTLTENKEAVQDYLEERLNGWAIVEEERQNMQVEIISDVGTIKEKEGVFEL